MNKPEFSVEFDTEEELPDENSERENRIEHYRSLVEQQKSLPYRSTNGQILSHYTCIDNPKRISKSPITERQRCAQLKIEEEE